MNALKLKYEDVLKTEKADLRRIRELRDLGRELTQQQKLAVNFKDCRPESAKKAIPLDRREKGMKKQYEQAFSTKSTMSSVQKRPLSSSGKKTAQSDKARSSGAKTQSFAGTNKSIRAEQGGTQTLQGSLNDTAGKSQMSTASNSVTKMSGTGGIVKTVILPYDEINNIKAELEYLKDYKARQKSLFEEAIQGYQKDKVIRLQEYQLKEKDM